MQADENSDNKDLYVVVVTASVVVVPSIPVSNQADSFMNLGRE